MTVTIHLTLVDVAVVLLVLWPVGSAASRLGERAGAAAAEAFARWWRRWRA